MKRSATRTLEDIDHFNRSIGADEPTPPASPSLAILSSREFVAGYVAPDYLVHKIMQRRYLYSLTAPTGAGKTAVALLLSAMVGLGAPLGDLDVEQGSVLYLAGENPDDIRARWIAMADEMKFSIDAIPVHFIPGKFRIPEQRDRIAKAAQGMGGLSFIVVDTTATFFDGDEENDNVQRLEHARMLRTLTEMPGRPCVLANSHPVKNAGADNLIPRGGGSFIAELDGNLVCIKSNSTVDLHWQGKLRGPDFEPVPFQLLTVNSEKLVDSKGRRMPTVVAKALSSSEKKNIEAAARSTEDAVLVTMLNDRFASMSQIAEVNQWFLKDQTPNKPLVQRILKKMAKDRLVKNERGAWELTDKGQDVAKKLKINADLAGSRYD